MTTSVTPSPRKKQKLSSEVSSGCIICHTPTSKYRCPRCLRSTCSLACIKQHKQLFQCDGQVERSSYKSLNQLHDSDIIKDYSLLQDVAHTIDGSRRNPVLQLLNKHVQNKRSIGINNRVSALEDDSSQRSDASASKSAQRAGTDLIRQSLPAGLSTAYSTYAPRFRHLATVAETHQCTLLLLPSGMQLHQRNSSTADLKAQSIQWRLELQCTALSKPLVRAKVNDEITWKEVISQMMGMSDPAHADVASASTTLSADTVQPPPPATDIDATTPPTSTIKPKRQKATHAVNPILKHQLQQYISAGIDSLHFFLPVPLQPSNAQRWYRIDVNQTIRHSLQGKVVIEFPVLHVALNAEEAAQYDTSDPIMPGSARGPQLEDGELGSDSSDESDEDSEGSSSDVDDDVKAAALAEFDALIGAG